MAAPKAIAASKNIIQQQQQNIKQFTSEALKYTQEKTYAEISCSFIKKEAPALEFFFKIIKNSFTIKSFIEHLRQLLLEEHKILLKTVPIAIPNDISKTYYQKGFVICFTSSTYSRFMEFLIESYNKVFLDLEFSLSLEF